MAKYTIQGEDLKYLQRLNTTLIGHEDSANALRKEIQVFVSIRVLPKLGVRINPGENVPLNVDFEKGEIEVGITRPASGLVLPKQ